MNLVMSTLPLAAKGAPVEGGATPSINGSPLKGGRHDVGLRRGFGAQNGKGESASDLTP